LHRFPKPQQSFRKGKLSHPANGTTPADRVRLADFFFTRQFLRIQPSVGFRGRPFKNHLLNQMGNLHLRMPFALINAGATFQRAMDMDFRGLINKCVVVYLDDVIVYSKNREEHIQHLTQIFERSRKYGILLNPKKTIFNVEEGNLLGHIISRVGIHIDPERIKAIA
jgi:hypothetical protein